MEPGAEFPRCRKGGFWQEPSIWPLCVEPPKCDPSIGPSMPLSVNNSGLVGAYTELLEGEFTEFRCNDSIRAISGGNQEMIVDEPTATDTSDDASSGAADSGTDNAGEAADDSGNAAGGGADDNAAGADDSAGGADTAGAESGDTGGDGAAGTNRRRRRDTSGGSSGTRKIFRVTCGSSGNWEAPYDEDWPTCELLPDKHCSVVQDLNNTIPDGFKLKDAGVSQVLNGETLMFVCSSSADAAVMADGSRVTEFGLTCSDTGEFDPVWPTKCEPFQVITIILQILQIYY